MTIESKHNEHFFVITGGPGAGKTTLLNEFKNMNYRVVPEIARELIIEQQELGGEALPWRNKNLYLNTMFHRSIESYEQVERYPTDNTPIFFDRGFLDSICYGVMIQSMIDENMNDYADKWRYNKKVFMLPPWHQIYTTDSERKQSWKEALLTYDKMIETYQKYGYETIEVPRLNVNERAHFVLDEINRSTK